MGWKSNAQVTKANFKCEQKKSFSQLSRKTVSILTTGWLSAESICCWTNVTGKARSTVSNHLLVCFWSTWCAGGWCPTVSCTTHWKHVRERMFCVALCTMKWPGLVTPYRVIIGCMKLPTSVNISSLLSYIHTGRVMRHATKNGYLLHYLLLHVAVAVWTQLSNKCFHLLRCVMQTLHYATCCITRPVWMGGGGWDGTGNSGGRKLDLGQTSKLSENVDNFGPWFSNFDQFPDKYEQLWKWSTDLLPQNPCPSKSSVVWPGPRVVQAAQVPSPNPDLNSSAPHLAQVGPVPPNPSGHPEIESHFQSLV